MTRTDLSLLRVANLRVSDHRLKKPKDVVSWMGAMQAQDYAMARWAVGVRLPGIFWPVIVYNGQVIGRWKKTTTRGGVKVDMNFFSKRKPDPAVIKSVGAAAARVENFFEI